MKIAILVQGNIHINSILALKHYLEITDEIVYSTWSPCDSYERRLLNFLNKKYKDRVKIVVHEYPDVSSVYNERNSYYQIVSVLNGLKHITSSDYVIKIRSSYRIGNINPFLKVVHNTDKYVVSVSFGFARPNITMYHPSDQMFGCKRVLMNDVFSDLRFRYINNFDWSNINGFHNELTIESKICLCFIQKLGIVPVYNSEECQKIMRHIYDIVNINDLDARIYFSYYGVNIDIGQHDSYFAKHI